MMGDPGKGDVALIYSVDTCYISRVLSAKFDVVRLGPLNDGWNHLVIMSRFPSR